MFALMQCRKIPLAFSPGDSGVFLERAVLFETHTRAFEGCGMRARPSSLRRLRGAKPCRALIHNLIRVRRTLFESPTQTDYPPRCPCGDSLTLSPQFMACHGPKWLASAPDWRFCVWNWPASGLVGGPFAAKNRTCGPSPKPCGTLTLSLSKGEGAPSSFDFAQDEGRE